MLDEGKPKLEMGPWSWPPPMPIVHSIEGMPELLAVLKRIAVAMESIAGPEVGVRGPELTVDDYLEAVRAMARDGDA